MRTVDNVLDNNFCNSTIKGFPVSHTEERFKVKCFLFPQVKKQKFKVGFNACNHYLDVLTNFTPTFKMTLHNTH